MMVEFYSLSDGSPTTPPCKPDAAAPPAAVVGHEGMGNERSRPPQPSCYNLDISHSDWSNNTFRALRIINSTHDLTYAEFTLVSDMYDFKHVYKKELFDVSRDPFQLKNLYDETAPAVQRSLHEALRKEFTCKGRSCASWAPKALKTTDSAAGTSSLVLVAPASNDVWKLLEGQSNLQRADTLAAGLSEARPGDGLLVMAVGYPASATPVPPALLAAAERGVRVYIEYAGAGMPLSASSGACVNRSSAAPTVTVTSSFVALCAPAPGSHVSHIKYSGVACGAGKIRWTGMANLDPAPADKGKQCSWNASALPAAWAAQWTGGCGVAPTMMKGLPMRFCGSGPPIPKPSPPVEPAIKALRWTQRSIITTDELAPELPRWRILQLQSPNVVSWCPSCGTDAVRGTGCAAACSSAILSAAQVAGFDSAAFNATAAELSPLLFRLPPSANNTSKTAVPMLVSTTRLSSMVSGRFVPLSAWRGLWQWILKDIAGRTGPKPLLPEWTPPVRPAYRMSSALPADGETAAAVASARWLANASTLVVANDERSGNDSSVCCVQQKGQVCEERNCSALDVCPSPYAPAGVVNSTCIQEGWSSVIKADGSQAMMPLFIRTDGNSEAGMGLATAATLPPPAAAATANVTAAERAR